MPKRLNIHPNERVDLVDFSNASSGYTTDKSAFTLDRTFRDSFSRFLRGFEVSFNGNQITVFNGVAIDRFGEVLNSEDQANTSRTFTIPTTPNQAYFVEVFFEETDSDTDSRAFWDPTFTNPPPIPSGREFFINVSTRVTPDWNVDFNTSGFAVTTNPNSRRIPLIQVKTGISGAIDPGAAGFLFGTGVLSTVTTFDSAATDTTLRVVDATAFVIGDAVTVDALGVGSEAAVIGNIDYDNAILTLSGPLTNAHLAGSVVRRTAGNTFLLQDTNPNGLAGRADVRKRMFQGDEIRGSALTVDTNAILPTDRSDLSVFSVKDEVDFLSAQIRELKFGALRSDTNQAVLPSTFALAPRYYDNAGGVAGARSYSVTIGDGINSFGDFNGLDELPFLAAVAFLQTLPTPGGTVFVKRGTYLFTSMVTVDINVSFVGEGRKLTILSNQSATDPLFELANTGLVARDVTFNSLEMTRINTATPTGVLVAGVAVRPYFQDCNLEVDVEMSAAPIAVYGTNSLFRRIVFTTSAGNVRLYNCDFVGPAGLGNITGPITDSVVDSCRFFTGSGLDLTTVSGLSMTGCALINPLMFAATTSAANVRISNCSYSGSATGPASVISATDASNFIVSNCRFRSSQTGTTSGSRGSIIRFTDDTSRVQVTGCMLESNSSAFVDGVVFDTTLGGTITGTQVTGLVCTDTFASVLVLGGNTAGNSLKVSDVTVTGTGAGRTHRGVQVLHSSGGSLALQVVGCDFSRMEGTTPATDVSAVRVSGTSNNNHDILVANCRMNFTSSVNNVYGVQISGTSNVAASVTVEACQFSASSGAPTATMLACLASNNVSITNSKFRDVVSTAASFLNADSCNGVIAASNSLSNVTSGTTTLMLTTDCSNVQVDANNVNVTAFANMTVIEHATTSGLSSNVSLSKNQILLNHSSSSIVSFGVRVNAAATLSDIHVDLNSIQSLGGGLLNGIRVDSSTLLANLTTNGNTITEAVANAATTPIFIDRVSGVFTTAVVANNSITAPVAARTPTRAIFVSGADTVSITGNTGDFLGGIGIETQLCNNVSAVGNTIQQSYLLAGVDVTVMSNTLDRTLASIILDFATNVAPCVTPFTKNAAFVRQFNICASVSV